MDSTCMPGRAFKVNSMAEGKDIEEDQLSLRSRDRKRQYFCGFLEGKSGRQPGFYQEERGRVYARS